MKKDAPAPAVDGGGGLLPDFPSGEAPNSASRPSMSAEIFVIHYEYRKWKRQSKLCTGSRMICNNFILFFVDKIAW